MNAPADGPGADEMPDDALVARYRDAGDVDALDRLVRRHSDTVWRYLRGMFSEAADAQDAFQEVWLRVIRRSDAYRNQNFRGWLLRIAHNVAIDRYRRQRPGISLDAEAGDGVGLAETLPSRERSPRGELAGRECLDRLAELIRELPETQREVFLMRTVGELSFKEVARALRVPLNTALGRMHYAVTRLREALGAEAAQWSEGREP